MGYGKGGAALAQVWPSRSQDSRAWVLQLSPAAGATQQPQLAPGHSLATSRNRAVMYSTVAEKAASGQVLQVTGH